LGAVGQQLGMLIAANGNVALSIGTSANTVLGNIGSSLQSNFSSASVGAISSYLTMELGQSLGLRGFGAELVNTAGSSLLSKVLSNVASNQYIFSGFNLSAPAQSANASTAFSPGGAATLLANAVGSFLGAKLGAAVYSPTTQSGVVLSSVGSALGAFEGGVIGTGIAASGGTSAWMLGNIVLPGIGAFVGFVLGAIIGDLFGSSKPRIPTASAQSVLQIPYANYQVANITSANGGSTNPVVAMAQTAANTLNGIFAQIAGNPAPLFVANTASPTQVYGYTGGQLWLKEGGTSAAQINVTTEDQAVDQGVLWALPQTQVIGGNIFLKRAIQNTQATSVTSLMGDLQVASDFSFYEQNTALINGYISQAYNTLSAAQQNYYAANKALVDQIDVSGLASLNASQLSTYNANQSTINAIVSALQAQSIANPWIITLQRANELGLQNFNKSDFFGGLYGFLQSFGLNASSSINLADIRLGWNGSTLSISTPSTTGVGTFTTLPQALNSATNDDVFNPRFQDNLLGWNTANWNTPGGFEKGVNLNADWSGSGNDSLFEHMFSTPAVGALVDTRSDFMPSQAGLVYYASVYAGQHRGQAQLLVEYYNANKQIITSTYMSGAAVNGGGYHGDIANYGLLSGFSVAPVGAAYRVLNLRLAANGGSDPYVFFTRPVSVLGSGTVTNDDVVNPRFQSNLVGWNTQTWNTPGGYEKGVNLSADWSGSGNDSLFEHMFSTPAVGAVEDTRSDFMPSQAGVTYYSSVYAAQHRGAAQLLVEYYNANKQIIAQNWMSGVGRESGGWHGDLANYNLLSGYSTAPAGTAYRVLNLRLVANGGSDPYAFFARPVSVFSNGTVTNDDVVNPHFLNNLLGWNTANWNTPGGFERGVSVASDWSGSGNDALFEHMFSTPAVGALVDTRSDFMPSQAGVTYYSSIYAAQHRGAAQLLVEYYNANKQIITQNWMSGVGRESGGWHGDLANYNLVSGYSTAPAGTAYRVLNLRLVANGGSDPYAFFTRPVSVLGSNTAIQDWSPGAPQDWSQGSPQDWSASGQGVAIDNFLATMGYTNWGGSTTGGQEIINYKGSTAPVNINLTRTFGTYIGSQFVVQDLTDKNDIVLGGDGGNYIVGGAGNSWIQGGSGNNYLQGGTGTDVLVGGSGHNMLVGGPNGSIFVGGSGDNIVDDWSGKITNVAGQNIVNFGGMRASGGANTFFAGSGSNYAWGGSGSDTYIANQKSIVQQFNGGGGLNTISFQKYTVAVNANLNNLNGSIWDGAPVDALSPIPGQNIYTVNVQNIFGSSYNDTLQSGQSGGVLEGGGGADALIGGGGITTVSYQHSSAGVYVSLAAGQAYGGDATGDTFQNIQNVTGSNYNDILQGLPGSTLSGLLGNDTYLYSGGGNRFVGGSGFNTVDYSSAPSSVWVNLVSGAGAVGGKAVDYYTNISEIIGSPFGSTIYGSSTGTTFIATGGTNTFVGQGNDNIYLNQGGGTVIVNDVNSLTNTITVGPNLTWDNLWIGTSGGSNGFFDIGVRGSPSDYIHVPGNFGAYPLSSNNIIKSLSLNGASTADIGQVTYAVGGNGASGQTLNGLGGRYNMIFAYGGNNTINAEGTLSSTGGALVVPGATVNGGATTINVSGGDDQIALERGDGHFVMQGGTGGNKTILFGSTVAATDVIYQIDAAGNLWVGLSDPTNASLAASQVANNIELVSGGTYYFNRTAGVGGYLYNTYVQAGGQNINVNNLNLNWVTINIRDPGGRKPIVIDLSGDGLELTKVATSNIVTKSSNGVITQMGWVGPTNGILVYDRAKNGNYNTLSDISFINDKAGATSDLEGLAGWDTNGDGVLNASDSGWSKLRVWVDKNQDGVAESGELFSFDQLGIKSINLKIAPTGFTSNNEFDSFASGTATVNLANGATTTAYDVTLARQFIGASTPLDGANGVDWTSVGTNGVIGSMTVNPLSRAGGKAASLSYQALTQLGAYNFTGQSSISRVAAAFWAAYLDPTAIQARLAAKTAGFSGLDTLAEIKATPGPVFKGANRGSTAHPSRLQVLVLGNGATPPSLEGLSQSNVTADVGQTGVEKQIGWVGRDNAILVDDRTGMGIIDIPTETSFQQLRPVATTSLDGLAALDTNRDGAIDAGDAAFDHLKLWFDTSQRGQSASGVLLNLKQAGVQSINLSTFDNAPDHKDLSSNQILAKATVQLADGTSQILYDVALAVSDPSTKPATTTPASNPPSLATLAAPTALSPALVGPATNISSSPLPSDQSLGNAANVSAPRANQDGPSSDVVGADIFSVAQTNWWDSQSSTGAVSSGPSVANAQTPGVSGATGSAATNAIDAASLQQQLLLRQSVTAFQADTGAAPALWNRSGSADLLSTLTAAAKTTAPANANTAAKPLVGVG
jgi:hypothetical protein